MPNLRMAKHPAPPVAKHSHQRIFDNSTDREMAVAIGLYIIGLQRDLTTFIEDRIATNGHNGLSSRIAREEALAEQAVKPEGPLAWSNCQRRRFVYADSRTSSRVFGKPI